MADHKTNPHKMRKEDDLTITSDLPINLTRRNMNVEPGTVCSPAEKKICPKSGIERKYVNTLKE